MVIFLYQRLVYQGSFEKIKIITFEMFVGCLFLSFESSLLALFFIFMMDLMGKGN